MKFILGSIYGPTVELDASDFLAENPTGRDIAIARCIIIAEHRAAGWTWESIGELFRTSPGYARRLYLKGFKFTIERMKRLGYRRIPDAFDPADGTVRPTAAEIRAEVDRIITEYRLMGWPWWAVGALVRMDLSNARRRHVARDEADQGAIQRARDALPSVADIPPPQPGSRTQTYETGDGVQKITVYKAV